MARQAMKRTPVKQVEEEAPEIETEEVEEEEVAPPAEPTEEQKRDWEFISRIVKGMEKECGKGSVLVPTRSTILGTVEHWASTRNFMIDYAIAGGLPMPRPIIPFGRITEIAGLNETGKTTLLSQILAETQRLSGIAAIVDVEHTLDLSYMELLGVDLSRLIIAPADTIEEGFHKAKQMVKTIMESGSDKLVALGWDSLGATPTQAQMDSDDSGNPHGVAAKIVGQNLQTFNGMIAKHKIALIFTNHVWHDHNVKYGDPYKSYAGEKFRYFATLRLRLTKSGQIKEKEEGTAEDDSKQVIGSKIKVGVLKNKMAPYRKTVEVPCLGGLGFSTDYCVFEQGLKQGVINGTTWKTWETPNGEEVKFQGWRGFQEKVMLHPEYPALVETVVRNYYQKAG